MNFAFMYKYAYMKKNIYPWNIAFIKQKNMKLSFKNANKVILLACHWSGFSLFCTLKLRIEHTYIYIFQKYFILHMYALDTEMEPLCTVKKLQF